MLVNPSNNELLEESDQNGPELGSFKKGDYFSIATKIRKSKNVHTLFGSLNQNRIDLETFCEQMSKEEGHLLMTLSFRQFPTSALKHSNV